MKLKAVVHEAQEGGYWAHEMAQGKDELIERLRKTVFILMHETSWALSALRNACRGDGVLSKACAFRNLVRTFMSEVEGSVFTLAYHLSVRNGTDPPGRELLSGKDEEVRDRIALTLENFSRGIGEVMAVERGGSGWESFAQARRLRDRFEHPGGPESFEWNETELDELMKALTWWHAQVDGCLELDPEKYARWATQ